MSQFSRTFSIVTRIRAVGFLPGGFRFKLSASRFAFAKDSMAIALTVRLIAVVAWLIGGARYGGSSDPEDRRTQWLMNAAGLIGGVLLVVWFLPRGLRGEDEPAWVTWILVAMGVFLIYGALRDWLRGE